MEVSIAVVYSKKRRRSTTMRIKGRGEIELRAPQFLKPNQLFDFIGANPGFLSKALTLPQQHKLPSTLSTGMSLYLFGRQYLLELSPARKTEIQVDNENKAILIYKKGKTLTRKKLYELLAPTLQNFLTKNVAEIAEQMSETRYKVVRTKLVRSLWGSCSSNGNITFNKRLIHYSPEIITYVIVHELAHLQEQNHSKHFWSIVSRYFPDYKKARSVLKKSTFG